MSDDSFDNDNTTSVHGADAMRIFIFKSEARTDLRAFGGDPAGLQLPLNSSRGVSWALSRQIRTFRTKYRGLTSKWRLRNRAFNFSD
jgi:hypothetical protein